MENKEYSEVDCGIIYSKPLRLHYDNKNEHNIHRLYRISQIKTLSVLIYLYIAIAWIIVILCLPIIKIRSREIYYKTVQPLVKVISEFDVWRKYRYTVKEWCKEVDIDLSEYYSRREKEEEKGRNFYQEIY